MSVDASRLLLHPITDLQHNASRKNKACTLYDILLIGLIVNHEFAYHVNFAKCRYGSLSHQP